MSRARTKAAKTVDGWQAMVRDTTGQELPARKGRKKYAPKEEVPGFCWVQICDGQLTVAAYIRHEANEDAKDTETERPYVRMMGSEEVPEVIGLTIRQGPKWKAGTKFKDRYTPVEAFPLLESEETVAAWAEACTRIQAACSK